MEVMEVILLVVEVYYHYIDITVLMHFLLETAGEGLVIVHSKAWLQRAL